MFTEALFIIAKASKQPKCPLTGMDKDDVVHICMDYSSIKKKEITPFVVTRMGLETVMPSEVNQIEEKYDIPYMWDLKRNDTNELI